MAEVIYRKYRPHSFADIVGQDNVVNLLKTSVASGDISHAYLFSGPRGTGKTSTARIMAKALSCLNFSKNNDVCNECAICVDINNGTNMDLIEIDAASNRGIEEIRQLKDNINFLPTSGKYKVYIIDEVHMLTKEAFNALLKTLEEPPAHVIFILATTEPHKIPLTVLSRLQKYTFKLAAPDEMVSKLERIAKAESLNIDAEGLRIVADISEGGYRDAESLLGKIIASHQGESAITGTDIYQLLGMPETSTIESFIQLLLRKDGIKAAEFIENIYEQGIDLHQFQSRLLDYLSKQINKSLLSGNLLNNELGIMQTLLKLQSDYQYIDNPRLILQLLILRSTELKSSEPVVKSAAPETPNVPVVPSKSMPKVETTKPVTEAQPAALPTAKITPEASGDDNAAKWEAVITQSRKISLQLWLILKICRVEWENDSPVMVISHPSHLDTLNSEAMKPKVQDLLQKVYAIDTEIPYKLDQNVSFAVNEPSANEGPKLSSDNSQLVESIF